MFSLRAICVVVLAIALLGVTQDGRAVDCFWLLVDVTTVTTYGEICNPDGTTTSVPIGSTTYYYYDLSCNQSFVVSVPVGGTMPQLPAAPGVTIVGVDTTNPDSPLYSVSITTDLVSPATQVTLTGGNGGAWSSAPVNASGIIQMAGPSIGSFGDGTMSFTAEACNDAALCASHEQNLMRYTPSALRVEEDMTADWIEGRFPKTAVFGHVYRQTYTTTSFSVSETGENSHYELRDSTTTVAHQAADPEPLWEASWTTHGTLHNGEAGANGCAAAPPCYIPCASLCASTDVFGYAPWIEDHVSNVRISTAPGSNTAVTGGNLQVWP